MSTNVQAALTKLLKKSHRQLVVEILVALELVTQVAQLVLHMRQTLMILRNALLVQLAAS